jgi:hypothetical protein
LALGEGGYITELQTLLINRLLHPIDKKGLENTSKAFGEIPDP